MTIRVTFDELVDSTRRFARLHWTDERTFPSWRRWDTFLQGPVPYYEFGGCYALFSRSSLQYVGLGASGGNTRYPARGLSRRMMSHVYQGDRARGDGWLKLRPTWTEIDEIYTLGFEYMDYMAAALEAYLIRTLHPPRNRHLKVRVRG